MITFEDAKNLKAGDVVFADGYRCSVVKIKVDKKAKTVAVSYTDGSPDTFVGSNERLSLDRPEASSAAGKARAAKEAEQATPHAGRVARRTTPLPTADMEPVARIQAGVAREAEWSSLEWFEEDRAEIARAISGKLGIPIEQFADTNETALFHFMSLALAVGAWLRKSGWREIGLRDTAPMNQLERLARSKAMAGILVRLFSHSYVGNIGEVRDLGGMLRAFTQACDVSETLVGHVLTAHSYVRQSTLLMARHLADGAKGAAPVTVDFFGPYREFLESDPDEFMPRRAAIDACLQLSSTLQFLSGHPALPISLEPLPREDSSAHQFLRKYLALAGLHRTPAVFRAGELSFEAGTLDVAIESLADDTPWVLIDPIFQNADGAAEIVIAMDPLARRDEPLEVLIGRATRGLAPPPIIWIAMHPMF